jgi:hypothetical protein
MNSFERCGSTVPQGGLLGLPYGGLYVSSNLEELGALALGMQVACRVHP